MKVTEQPIDTSTAAGKCFLDMLVAHLFVSSSRSARRVGALLGGAEDERGQAKRNSLAANLAAEAKALAELKIEKAAVEGERRMVEADLRPVRYLAKLLGAGDQDVLRWLLDPAYCGPATDAVTG